jgi:hypothetical protein
VFALGLGPRHAGSNPFHTAGPFELSDACQHPGDEPTRRCRRVDPLSDRDKRDLPCVELVEEKYEMPQIAPQAIELPTDDRLNFVPSNVNCQPVKRRAPVFAPDTPWSTYSTADQPRAWT